MSDKKLTTLRPKGWFFRTDLDTGKVTEYESLLCVHCGLPFPIMPGSGRTRGYCMDCRGPVCGPGCATCTPTERLLENLEAGRDPNHRTITGRVEAAPPRASEGGILLPAGVDP